MKKKVVLIGDFAVGKTSLIRRFVDDQFSDDYLTTIGVKISTKKMKHDELELDLILWDIQGKSSIMDFPKNYLVGADYSLLVGDLMRTQTLEHLEEYKLMIENYTAKSKVLLALNKSDLMASEDLKETTSSRFVNKLGCEWFYTSAQSGHNVRELFSRFMEIDFSC